MLIRDGFEGRVRCSGATRALCAIFLADSGFLQERGAGFATRHRFGEYLPARPLYTMPSVAVRGAGAGRRRNLQRTHDGRDRAARAFGRSGATGVRRGACRLGDRCAGCAAEVVATNTIAHPVNPIDVSAPFGTGIDEWHDAEFHS